MKKQAQRGNYAPAHNPATTPTPGYHPPAFTNATPYQQETAYTYGPQSGVPAVELHGNTPQYGASANYYNAEPVKPAQMV
jgi:hypothetical protein